jgi:hypothetical protein
VSGGAGVTNRFWFMVWRDTAHEPERPSEPRLSGAHLEEAEVG